MHANWRVTKQWGWIRAKRCNAWHLQNKQSWYSNQDVLSVDVSRRRANKTMNERILLHIMCCRCVVFQGVQRESTERLYIVRKGVVALGHSNKMSSFTRTQLLIYERRLRIIYRKPEGFTFCSTSRYVNRERLALLKNIRQACLLVQKLDLNIAAELNFCLSSCSEEKSRSV